MKTYTLTSLAAATLILVGCGGGSSSSSSPSPSSSTQIGTTIQVVRGTVLGAVVRDDNGTGTVAISDGNGTYRFTNTIKYPVVATGGVIDMNRDGKVGVGDVKNDMNLTCESGSVITLATTFSSKPDTKALLVNVATSLGITKDDFETKTPLNSKKIEAISNVLYKYAKENNISVSTFSAIEKDISTEYQKYTADVNHNSETTEQELVTKLSDNNNVQKLQTDTEVTNEVQSINNEYSAKYKEASSAYERENGDIEYGENSTSSVHSQGVSCASCHSFVNGSGGIISREFEGREGGEGGENQFTSGATIFTKLHAVGGNGIYGANNYRIRLRLENNATVTYNSGRGTGNVNGTFNSVAINKYTAEVLNASGVVTNKSLENSHDTARLDCNSCHTEAGSSIGGSLRAPGRIVSFDYYGTLKTVANIVTAAPVTPTPVTPTPTTTTVAKSFQKDVLPILNSKCVVCHGGSNIGTTFLQTNQYTNVNSRVNTTTPTASKLLQKASGQTGHGGGSVFSTTSGSYITLKTWISEGAKNN